MSTVGIQTHEANWEEINEELKRISVCPGRVTLEHKRMYRVVTSEGEWLSVCSGALEYEAEERRDFPSCR